MAKLLPPPDLAAKERKEHKEGTTAKAREWPRMGKHRSADVLVRSPTGLSAFFALLRGGLAPYAQRLSPKPLATMVTSFRFELSKLSITGNEFRLRVEGLMNQTIVLDLAQDLRSCAPRLTNAPDGNFIDLPLPMPPGAERSVCRARVG